jgi:transposase-like protein
MINRSDPLLLIPLYCPNILCEFHRGSRTKFYIKNGWIKTDKPPFKNQRFICKHCRTQFSENTFKLDFRKKLSGIQEDILHFSMNGMSNNSIARVLKVAEGTVRDRLTVMARQSLYFEKLNAPQKISEDVAYDGFETFTYSQFSPCYINTAVGKHSFFIFHNTLSPLNRKGRMTIEQKLRNSELRSKFGPYPSDSVFEETRYILERLQEKGRGYTLFTDEHRAYLRAVRSMDFKMNHATISSSRRRDCSNPLFPINHLHLLYRHFFSSQHRETISFQKHEAALLEKIQLMKVYRNFMQTKFVKKNRFDSHAHKWSPAMYLGITDRVLNFKDVFQIRWCETQIALDHKERDFIRRVYPFSRQKIVG